MKLLAVAFLSLLSLTPASAVLITKTVDYTDEKGAALQGYVVYDDTFSTQTPE